MGAMGWMKCPLASTNKRFLVNTIKNTLHSQKEQDPEQKQKEGNEESEPSQSREETKPKRHRMHPYTPSFKARRRVSYSPPRHRNRSQHTKDKYEKQSSK
ncbi:protein POLR1D isoform X2 [Hemicordylus capensis]|nr:protein POLR1D isoform X2 [Hemicordylus capensis]